jgi:ADP-heptose:LPS heptosyltransferase
LPPGRVPFLQLPPGTAALRSPHFRKLHIRGRKLLLIHPGSGGPKKNWPPDLFLKIATWWKSFAGEVAFLLGPAESKIANRFEGWPTLSDLSLPILAAILSSGTAYVGNDSGVTHLAAALGVTTLVLFRCSEPKQWAPRANHVVVFQKGYGKIHGKIHATVECAIPLKNLEEILHRETKEDHEETPDLRGDQRL